jgi:hypothetical protein
MHSPEVVAFDVRLPIPIREKWAEAHAPKRWTLGRRTYTNPDNLGQPIRAWWRPSGYRPVVAGRCYRMVRFATIWHMEPNGRDSLTVCGKSKWRWHIHHWSVQLLLVGRLRRTLLTRCAWCGGGSRKGDPVNCSKQWDSPKRRWWQGERGLFHQDCSSISTAHASCTCTVPVLEHWNYGRCAVCNLFRAWRNPDKPSGPRDETTEILKSIPAGQRDPAKTAQVRALWKAHRALTKSQEEV